MRSALLPFVCALAAGSDIVNARALQGPHYQHVLENLDWTAGTGFLKEVAGSSPSCETLEGGEGKFGVGIEFTSTYAIAAVKYENGTFIDIPKMDNTEDYASLIKRVSNSVSPTEPIPTLPPPCSSLPSLLTPLYSLLEKVNDFFHPALIHPMPLSPSPETDIHLLTTFLNHLKADIESHLGHCITASPISVIIASEFSSLARTGGMGTAFAAADMRLLRVSEGEQQRIAAAWVGMGYDYSPETSKRTLAISFSKEFLTVTTASVQSSHEMLQPLTATYPQLGFSRKDTFTNNPMDLEKGYWDAIKGVLMSAAHRGSGDVERVLVMGETAGEKAFLDALWWVLQELDVGGLYGELQVVGFDPSTVVGRGAAEMALTGIHL